MASAIDVTKPATGAATTQSVRDNFQAAKDEIEALQSGAGFIPPVVITDQNAGSGVGPVFDLFRESGSPAADDLIGAVEFSGEDDISGKLDYAIVQASIVDPANLAPRGRLTFGVGDAGAVSTALTIESTVAAGGPIAQFDCALDMNLFPLNIIGNAVVGDGTNGIKFVRNDDSERASIDYDFDADQMTIVSGEEGWVFRTAFSLDPRMFIDGLNGHVAIGNGITEAGNQPLSIVDSTPTIQLEDSITAGNPYAWIRSEDGNLTLAADRGTDAAGSFIQFTVDNDEKMRIDDSGNVGIGTSSPATLLHLEGTNPNFRLVGTSGTGGTHDIRPAGTNDDLLSILADKAMLFSTDGVQRMRITDTGRVGIDTTGPVSKLHVSTGSDSDNETVSISLGSLTANARCGAIEKFTGTANDNRELRIRGSVNTDAEPIAFWPGTSAEAMRVDSSGNVGIGTDSPDLTLHVNSGASNVAIKVESSDSGAYVGFLDPNTTNNFSVNCGAVGDAFNIVAGGANRARVTSDGDLLVGAVSESDITGGSANAVGLDGANGVLRISKDDTAAQTVAAFYNPNGPVGTITINGTATTYNTSSDVRLKENIQPALASGPIIDAIEVVKFDWKADGSHQRFGFIAQDLDHDFPEAVSRGETEDDMWGVDYSKLVPLLVREIQSLRMRVEALGG